METLESLAQFVEKFPQLKREEIKYAFTGGTAVRLHQEKNQTEEKRFLSDLDILAFEDESYPIHTFMKKDVSFVTSLSLSEVKNMFHLLI